MKLKDYLKNKPSDECFDLVVEENIGRDLHLYREHEIIKIEEKHNRKTIYLTPAI